MTSQPIRIPFPVKGLTTNLGYESGDIQTTRDCLNVSPDSAQESRLRGGARTGLQKRYSTSVEGQPTFVTRVAGTGSGDIYEYIVVGTQSNVFVGQSSPTSATYPIGYSEILSSLSATLATEGGDVIIDEDDSSGDVPLITYDFAVEISSNGVSTAYRDRVIINSEGGSIASDTGATATSTSSVLTISKVGTDWTTLGIDAAGGTHYVEITSSSESVIQNGTYKVTSLTSSNLTIEGPAAVATSGAETVDYSIKEGVRDLNPSTPSLTVLYPTGGFVPLNADDVITYRDRLVWASGRTWYMSKQGDAGNYDYALDPEDPTRAVAGVNSGPGEPGDPINAMALAGYDYLIFFSDSAVWVMRGDPAYGGQLYKASNVAGCVSRTAWCYGRSTEIYFLGKDGLYIMEPNAGQIRSLSKDVLPRKLRNAEKDNYDTNLIYDPEDNCVLIFIVPKNGSAGENYLFDVDTQSFWPIKLQANKLQPLFGETFGGSPTRPRRATLISRDGFIRDWSGTKDDEVDIESHVVFGPYPATQMDNIDGFISEISSVIDEESVPVTVEVYTGSSAEEAVAKAKAATSPSYSRTIKSGRSITHRPRARGNSFCIRIRAVGSWAFESMSGMISPAGRTRR